MRLLTLLSLLSLSLFGESYEEFLKNQQREFNSYAEQNEREFKEYKRTIEKEFKQYKAIHQAELKKFKRELSRYWRDTKVSNRDEWIEYSPDKKRRKVINFKKSTIEIQIVAKPSKSIEKELMREVVKTVVETPKEATEKDELQKRVDKKFAKKSSVTVATSTKVDNQPILAGIFIQVPTPRELVKFAKKSVENIEERASKVTGQKVYSVKIDLPRNFPIRKARNYSSDIRKYAKKYKIEPALIFAIMHSESSYNPMARSHIPAYGLMQIVPRSAGIDAYYMVYKRKRVLSASYLYNSRNNIELGSAYLHILNYRYLKTIKNPVSRLYCVISAYNTGAGNVAKAFTGRTNVRKASKVINSMTPQQVYNTLLRKLPYDETKNYLKKVSKRYGIYQRANI